MSVIRISFAQAQATATQAPTIDREQLKEQIRQTIQDAAQQARDRAQQVRDAQQHVRDAQQQLRDAERQLRAARTTDERNSAMATLHDAEAAVREAQAAVPGQIVVHTEGMPGMPPVDMRNVIPPQAVDISIAFFVMCAVIIIGWPIARAFGRRLERRADGATDATVANQLQRIEQAVEAMSIEVERISESQRFMAKLQSDARERAAVPAAERR